MYAHLGFDLPQDSCSTLYEIHSGDVSHFYFEFVTIIELQWIDSQVNVRRIHF